MNTAIIRFDKYDTIIAKTKARSKITVRMLFLLSVLPALLISDTLNAQSAPSKFAVIGYLPEYRLDSIKPDAIRGVTDLIYFGLVPNKNGRLSEPPIPSAALIKLQSIKQQSRCRLLFSVGGWDRSNGFAELTSSPTTRQLFIRSLVQYCRQSGFHGIDYDWEHPKTKLELANYVKLITETSNACHPHSMIVTVAQAAWQNIGKDAYQAVDRLHLMTYDHDFPHATYDKSTKDIERVIGWGCAPEKLALGIPFYGRNKERKARTYAEITANQPVDSTKDLIAGFAFNGQATVAKKVRYAAEKNLAGVMIWELGQDSSRSELGLLEAIRKQVKSTATGK
jgi:GH18 family chitinase